MDAQFSSNSEDACATRGDFWVGGTLRHKGFFTRLAAIAFVCCRLNLCFPIWLLGHKLQRFAYWQASWNSPLSLITDYTQRGLRLHHNYQISSYSSIIIILEALNYLIIFIMFGKIIYRKSCDVMVIRILKKKLINNLWNNYFIFLSRPIMSSPIAR